MTAAHVTSLPDRDSAVIPGPVVLRLVYACYFACIGVSLPYFPPYLRALGCSGRQVALIVSAPPALYLFVPLIWGWMADRLRKPALLLRFALGGAALFYVPLTLTRRFPAILVVYLLQQTFNVSITGLLDSLALSRVRHGDGYGRIRLWGSMTAMATSAVLGSVLTARGQTHGDGLVPQLMVLFLGLAFAASLGLRGAGGGDRPHARDVVNLVRDRRFVFLLVCAGIHWSCASPYHSFFGILLRDRGLSSTVVGRAFLVGIAAEMVALYVFARLRTVASLPTLLGLAAAVSALRWFAIAAVTSGPALVALQAAHGFTFGVFWGTSLAWVAACVPSHLRVTGQAVFVAATYGVGNIVGFLSAGALYDAWNSAAPAFVIAGIVNLVPAVLCFGLGPRLGTSLGRQGDA